MKYHIQNSCVLVALLVFIGFCINEGLVDPPKMEPPKVDWERSREITPREFEQRHVKPLTIVEAAGWVC